MGRGVYDDDDDEWQALPDWVIHRKWATGHAIYLDPELDRSKSLYKYTRAADAFVTLRNRALWFSSPYKWEDPHEKWWCDQLFAEGSHLATAKAYGSSWTKGYLDEPFWRMYGCECKEDDDGLPRKRARVRVLPAVRFRANTGKLFDWLYDAASRGRGKAYMGSVRYCPVAQLVDQARQLRSRRDNASPTAAKGLLMKRLGYKFEREVRMLWIDRRDHGAGRGIEFEPLDLIDQVMIGPTKDEARYLEVEATLVELGIPPDRIEPSSIWTPPVVSLARSEKRP